MTPNVDHRDQAGPARLEIKHVEASIFHWGEFRSSNLRDAIAAARREPKA